MSGFTKTIKRTYTFDGDEVTVIFSRLKRRHMTKVINHLPTPGTDMTAAQSLALLSDLSEDLPDIIKRFEGLTDSEGEPVTLEDAVDEAYFTELFAEIFGDIAEQSFLSEKNAGN